MNDEADRPEFLARLDEVEKGLQAKTDIPYRPPGVVLAEDGTRASTDVSPRFRLLNFIGASVVRNEEWADIRIRAGGASFCYDYLVNTCWAAEVAAGRGTEGQTFTGSFGCTFKVFSTVQGAVTDLVAADAETFYTIGICGVTDEEVTWPNVSGTVKAVGLVGLNIGEDSGQAGTLSGIDPTQNGLSPIKLQAGAPAEMHLYNLYLGGTNLSTDYSIDGQATTTNTYIRAENCRFKREIFKVAHVRGFFYRCHLTGASGYGGFIPRKAHDMFIVDCTSDSDVPLFFDGITNTVATGDVDGLNILDNNLVGGATANRRIQLQLGTKILIRGNNLTRSGGDPAKEAIYVETASGTRIDGLEIAHNTFHDEVTSTEAQIVIKTNGAGASTIHGVRIIDNVQRGQHGAGVAATTAWVKLIGNSSNKIYGAIVAHNSYGSDADTADSIEDQGGFTLIGDYVEESVFGPNTLVSEVKYKITNGANNLFIPESADETGPPGSGTVPEAISQLQFTADTELTIDAAGAITVTQTHHTIDTRSDSQTDDLDTINGLIANQLYFFYPAHGDRTVVFKHGTDNILCSGNKDILLDDAHDFVWAFSPDGSTVYIGSPPRPNFVGLGYPDVELTLNEAGSITATQSLHVVDTFEDAAEDDLEGLHGGHYGDLLILSPASGDRTVNVLNAAGGIHSVYTADGQTRVLDDFWDTILLLCAAGGWWEVGPGNAPHGIAKHTEHGNWKALYTDGSGDEQELALGADGQVLKATGASAAPAFEDDEGGIEFLIDGGGVAITTGIKGWLEVPFACTIKSVRLLADQSGAIKVDLWVDSYANYPPTDADTITGGNEPEIAASGVKDEDATLTDWTTSLAKGDIIYYNVDSVTTIEKCLVALMVDKT